MNTRYTPAACQGKTKKFFEFFDFSQKRVAFSPSGCSENQIMDALKRRFRSDDHRWAQPMAEAVSVAGEFLLERSSVNGPVFF
jgi:hypothetical protein